jgi:L-aspartate oxidase
LTADFLVIGSGVAGLRAAAALASAGRVVVLTKSDPQESNTGYAQGGIAAAVGPDDSPSLHAADTRRAGDGLCDDEAVDVLTGEGPRYVEELIAWGARFDRNADGTLALGREAAHAVRRVLHAGDATGREIARALWERVRAQAAIEVVSDATVIALLAEDGAVAGARFRDASGAEREVRARATLLATGGAGQLYRETTNPGVATGDGIALAYHAGARVADLEFVQFHPTALDVAGAPRFLISEALRGEGARLVNADGERFMQREHPDGDLAPRDVVARGIARERMRTGRAVALTLAHLDADYVRGRFPTIAAACAQAGLDLARDPIPVGPAAHYMMGGVVTDVWGRTSLPGLFAAGEVACTGVHGANRLASNSLLEGLVFGARAGAAMIEGVSASRQERAGASMRRLRPPAELGTNWRTITAFINGGGAPPPPRTDADARPRSSMSSGSHGRRRSSPFPDTPVPPAHDHGAIIQPVRDLLWQSVGLFRTREGLEDAVRQLEAMAARGPVETNFLTVARLIARAALRRTESRGAHYREDFPSRDDERWRFHVVDALK